ncbi:MAG: hypothetical protein AM324_011765 [Candidatus Thorarchaeota archaeon SMTZ1-83]|nr:MAG: hypothetical protein AM324_13035 [Candidatus Thorarchaeota archaeon SMTZ1-83]
MSDNEKLPDIEYAGIDPYDARQELQINPEYGRFTLPRQKRKREYRAQYDAKWSEVVSFEVCEVYQCQDDKTWPLHEDLPDGFQRIGPAGMVYLFLMPFGRAIFPIWITIPLEDVASVKDLIEARLDRPSLPGLAHHGNAAAVRYITEHCEVLSKHRAQWYDWSKRGRQAKPNPKFRERGPDYVFCKEGMAIDFYGTGEQLEQMSLFWPWSLIKRVFVDNYEFSIRYEWHEDSYMYQQQVLDNDERRRISEDAEKALEIYQSSDDVAQIISIRPRSFPSRWHRTWDKLEAFSSKASRNRFPPIYDFVEDEPWEPHEDKEGSGFYMMR